MNVPNDVLPGRCGKGCDYPLVLTHLGGDRWVWVEADTRLPHRKCGAELVDLGEPVG